MSVCKKKGAGIRSFLGFGIALGHPCPWSALPPVPRVLRSTSIDFAENQLFPSSIGFSNSSRHFRGGLDYTFNSTPSLGIPPGSMPTPHSKGSAYSFFEESMEGSFCCFVECWRVAPYYSYSLRKFCRGALSFGEAPFRSKLSGPLLSDQSLRGVNLSLYCS